MTNELASPFTDSRAARTMSQHPFQHSVRILTCPNCGAPFRLSPAGGTATCEYCRATATFQPRTEQFEVAALQARAPVDEYDRNRKLREQEGKPLLPPAGLERLIVGGSIPGGLVPEAQAEWRRALAEVQGGGDFARQERLFFLTWALNDTPSHDEYWQRANVETALEALPAAQHRTQLRCVLARQAARAGDLASADAWLAPCDPSSYHLEVDSQYRFSQAYVAACRGDYPSVLRWVGERPGEVPIHEGLRLITGVFRADALEKTARLSEAVAQLRDLLRPGDSPDFLEVAVPCHPKLALCAQSLPAVRAASAAEETDAGGGAARAIGCLVAVPFLLLGTGFFVGGFFVDPARETDDGQMMVNHLFWLMGGSFLLCALAVPFFQLLSSRGRQRAAARPIG